jgi:hypothetical protein
VESTADTRASGGANVALVCGHGRWWRNLHHLFFLLAIVRGAVDNPKPRNIWRLFVFGDWRPSLFPRAVVIGSDRLEITASDAGSIAPSKAIQLGWSRRRRHIRARWKWGL